MKRLTKLKLLYSLVIILVGFSCSGTKSEAKSTAKSVAVNTSNRAQQPPNVIIILTDDQGYNDVSFNGSPDIKTPNIDRIANNGVRFSNGYVSYAVCGPSRAGLLTGRYQDRFGFSRNPLFAPKDSLQGLPTSEITLAKTLQSGGYRTMALGKWHLGAYKSQRPLKRGFDEFYGFLTGGHQYFPDRLKINDISGVKSQGGAYATKILRNDKRVEEKEYLTDGLSREAVSFVERNTKNPFFMYLAYNAPHAPLQATEKYLSRYKNIKDKKRRTYAAMISAVDDGVGKLLDKLDELHLTENTIVFFLSDNGGPKHTTANNTPFRGYKGSMFEGGIHVPFAVQWPGTLPKGVVYDKPIISLDIFATAVAQANITPKHSIDGVNLIPYLTGKNDGYPHEYLYWRMYDKKSFAIRNRDMKLMDEKDSGMMLFNLDKDLSEQHPITDKATEKRLKDLHTQWNSKNKKPVFLGLFDNKEYNELHPDRFKDGEKY
ncbi:sulfatase-like hydrolase/transferase [Tenacibaculum sp. UWU-22]|uniref:sulfatase-like hydrolase/transferase n=1 Tax=Tenacibaculum sp. UWU-22 TaxID=3234187 RepID=UPI0034DB5614